MLGEMQEPLSGTATKAKQALLKKLVAWAELGKERGEVAYASPRRDAGLCTIPPGGGYSVKNRTIDYG